MTSSARDRVLTRVRPRLTALVAVAAAISAAQASASAAPVRATLSQPAPIYVGDLFAGAATSAAGVVIAPEQASTSFESTVSFDRPGVVLDVDVVITGLTHESPYDLQLLLVGPGGEQALLMADAPVESEGVNALSLGFDDESDTPFNDAVPLSEGMSYQPEVVPGQVEMPPLAPPVGSPGNLSVFDGTDAAGEWHLYLHDQRGVGGEIAGWGVRFQLGTTPYPSTLSVAGMPGTITDLDVSLRDITSTFPGDLDVLLVGPQGQRATLMSDTGAEHDVEGLDLVLDDSATSVLPERAVLTSGRFQPTNHSVSHEDTYPGLTPTPVGAATLATFNGTDPNGVWSLYAVDDGANDFTEILGGWSLDIEVDGGVVPSQPGGVAPPPPAASQDTTSPTAKKLSPRRNAAGVAATAKVTVVASEQLAPASVTRRTVLLAKGTTRVKATVALKRGGTIVLTPKRRLVAGTYQVTLSPKVTDLAGNAFDGKAKRGVQTLRWRFTV